MGLLRLSKLEIKSLVTLITGYTKVNTIYITPEELQTRTIGFLQGKRNRPNISSVTVRLCRTRENKSQRQTSANSFVLKPSTPECDSNFG